MCRDGGDHQRQQAHKRQGNPEVSGLHGGEQLGLIQALQGWVHHLGLAQEDAGPAEEYTNE